MISQHKNSMKLVVDLASVTTLVPITVFAEISTLVPITVFAEISFLAITNMLY